MDQVPAILFHLHRMPRKANEVKRVSLERPRLRQFFFLAGMLLLFFSLTSCVKVRLTLQVNPDGSGTFGFALGVTQEARALMVSEGKDPLIMFESEFLDRVDLDQEASVRTWTEDEYEWAETSISFDSLREFNDLYSGPSLEDRLTLSKASSLFVDQFKLTGRLSTFDPTSYVDAEEVGFDPGAFFEFQLTANLPGRVIETNGEMLEEKATVVWSLSSPNPEDFLLITEKPNWVNIGILSGAIFLFAVVVVLLFRSRRLRGEVEPILDRALIETIAEQVLPPMEVDMEKLVDMASELYQELGHVIGSVSALSEDMSDIEVHAKNGEIWIIRCTTRSISGARDVERFISLLQRANIPEAAMITSGNYTAAAFEVVGKAKIHLLDFDILNRYMARARGLD